MQGKPEVIEAMLKPLKQEMGAISQYILHSELCSNWGYERLAKITKARAIVEMKHAERLAERILFLGGVPTSKPDAEAKKGQDVAGMIATNIALEEQAVELYNTSSALCAVSPKAKK